jgi:hypothetical protein
MDRDGRVNPEPSRRRPRPRGARRASGLDGPAGAVAEMREAGLTRPARSMTLGVDEEVPIRPAVIFCRSLDLAGRPGRAGRERSGKAERAGGLRPARRAGLKPYGKFSPAKKRKRRRVVGLPKWVSPGAASLLLTQTAETAATAARVARRALRRTRW